MTMAAIDSIQRAVIETDMDIDMVYNQFVHDWSAIFSPSKLQQVWEAALEMIPELN